MTATPAFSIVINNFNYSRFLSRSIDSALGQTLPAADVVVVDDASTDVSAEVIRGYGEHVVAVLKTRNAGHLAALRSGFEVSRGDVILFLDSDDYLRPDALACLAAVHRPETAMYQRRLELVDIDEGPLGVYPPLETALDAGSVAPQLAECGRISTSVTSGLAFSRRALEALGPWPLEDFRQGGDGYLAAAAPFHGEVVTVPGLAGAYRQHGANHAQFAQAVGAKARWRLEHDEARYAAIREQAARRGVPIGPRLGLGDAGHLEERIASLRLDPELHAYPGDRPARLLPAGLAAVARAPLPACRRAALMGWWVLAGLAPRRVAVAVISWRLSAGTRPLWVKRLARAARRLTGGRDLDVRPGPASPAVDSAPAA